MSSLSSLAVVVVVPPFRWVGTKHLRTIRLTGQLAFTVAKADILVFQGLDIAEVAKGLVVGISDYIT